MKKILKRQNGITLIALVITIIVLLILAGVAIRALTQTGLFGQANNAKVQEEIAREKEQIKIAVMASITRDTANGLNEIKIETLTEELYKYKDVKSVERVGATNCAEVEYKSERKYYVLLKDEDGKKMGTIEDTPRDSDKPIITDVKYSTKLIKIFFEDSGCGVNGYAIKTDSTQPEISDFYTYEEALLEGMYSTEDHEVEVQHGTEYYIYVKDSNGNISDAKQIKTTTIPSGTISFDQYGTNCTISTSSSGYTIQYKLNSFDEDGWVTGKSISNLIVGDVIYARLTDGTSNHSDYSSHVVESIETVPDADGNIDFNIYYDSMYGGYSCEMSSDTTYTIKYAVNQTSSWSTYYTPLYSLQNGDTIYAYLTDGTHNGGITQTYVDGITLNVGEYVNYYPKEATATTSDYHTITTSSSYQFMYYGNSTGMYGETTEELGFVGCVDLWTSDYNTVISLMNDNPSGTNVNFGLLTLNDTMGALSDKLMSGESFSLIEYSNYLAVGYSYSSISGSYLETWLTTNSGYFYIGYTLCYISYGEVTPVVSSDYLTYYSFLYTFSANFEDLTKLNNSSYIAIGVANLSEGDNARFYPDEGSHTFSNGTTISNSGNNYNMTFVSKTNSSYTSIGTCNFVGTMELDVGLDEIKEFADGYGFYNMMSIGEYRDTGEYKYFIASKIDIYTGSSEISEKLQNGQGFYISEYRSILDDYSHESTSPSSYSVLRNCSGIIWLNGYCCNIENGYVQPIADDDTGTYSLAYSVAVETTNVWYDTSISGYAVGGAYYVKSSSGAM